MVTNVLFVSVRNAGRTHMAEAWFNALAHPDKARASSAGVTPSAAVDERVVATMKEIGIDLSSRAPRLLTPLVQSTADVVIAIAPEPLDPAVIGVADHDVWLIDEPGDGSPERMRKLRGDVEKLVRRLLIARQWMPFGASAPPTAGS